MGIAINILTRILRTVIIIISRIAILIMRIIITILIRIVVVTIWIRPRITTVIRMRRKKGRLKPYSDSCGITTLTPKRPIVYDTGALKGHLIKPYDLCA